MGEIARALKNSRVRNVPVTPRNSSSIVEMEDSLYIGWRVYWPYIDNGKLGLTGSNSPWPSRTFHAICDGGRRKNTVLVDKEGRCREHLSRGDCSCGIYARSTLAGNEYFQRISTAVQIVGRCVGWGVVYEAASGFRAEIVRIEDMWLIPPPSNDYVGFYVSNNRIDVRTQWQFGLPSEATQKFMGLTAFTIPDTMEILSERYEMRCKFGYPDQ